MRVTDIVDKYLGMTPTDVGAKNWYDMRLKMIADIDIHLLENTPDHQLKEYKELYDNLYFGFLGQIWLADEGQYLLPVIMDEKPNQYYTDLSECFNDWLSAKNYKHPKSAFALAQELTEYTLNKYHFLFTSNNDFFDKKLYVDYGDNCGEVESIFYNYIGFKGKNDRKILLPPKLEGDSLFPLHEEVSGRF